MIIEYPKVLYNDKNVTVKVRNEEEDAKLSPFFSASWDYTKPVTTISYIEACRCLEETKDETKQETAVRKEAETNSQKADDSLNLQNEKNTETKKTKEEYKKAFQGIAKKLPSYSWKDLRILGKDIQDKLGVDLPLGAKRDVIESSIIEVLGNDNS